MTTGDGLFNVKESGWQDMPRERRISVVILICCGTIALVLSLLYMRSHVSSPFLVPLAKLEDSKKLYQQQQEEANQLETLKTKDTDRDGLSDYAELYVFHTSPYLADSDSDGLPDLVEVAQVSDPNCPQGKTCYQALVDVQQGTTSTYRPTDSENQAALKESVANGMNTSLRGFLNNPPPPESLTPEQMRSALVDNGLLESSQLDGVTDDMVTQLYQQTYQQVLQMQAKTQTTVATTTATATTPL